MGNQSSNLLYVNYPVTFSNLHPTLNDNLYPGRNGQKLDLKKITCGSGKKLWWVCFLNPCGCHIYEQVVNDKIGRNQGCPYCSGHKI